MSRRIEQIPQDVQPIIAALPMVQEGSAAPKIDNAKSDQSPFSLTVSFIVEHTKWSSRRNAFMENVGFLRCSYVERKEVLHPREINSEN